MINETLCPRLASVAGNAPQTSPKPPVFANGTASVERKTISKSVAFIAVDQVARPIGDSTRLTLFDCTSKPCSSNRAASCSFSGMLITGQLLCSVGKAQSGMNVFANGPGR
jgi:hypothetical protein